jgi:hypothetical protein
MQKNKIVFPLIGFILITLLSNLIYANPFENIQLTDGFEVIGRELNNILNKNFALLAIVIVALALLFYSIVNTALKKTPIGENKTISWSLSILIVGGIYYKTIPYGGMEKFLDNVLGQTVGIILIVFTIVIIGWLKGNKSMGTPLILASLLIVTWYFNQEQSHYLLVAILIIIFVLLRRFNVFSQDMSKGSIYNDKPATFKERKKWFERTKKAGKEIFNELKKDLKNAEEQEKFIKEIYQREQIHEKFNNFFESTTNKLKTDFNQISNFLKSNDYNNAKTKINEILDTAEEAIKKSTKLPTEIKEIKKKYKDWYKDDLGNQIEKFKNLNIKNEKGEMLTNDFNKINKLLKKAKEKKEELDRLEEKDIESYKIITKTLNRIKKETEILKKILSDKITEKANKEFNKNFESILNHLEILKEKEEKLRYNPILEERLLKTLYKININIKEILTKAEKEEKEDEEEIEKDFKNNSV